MYSDLHSKVILEWSYSPSDYLEEPYRRKQQDYELEVCNGKATATIDAETYDDNKALRDDIQSQLEGLFLGAQLIRRKPYKLSGPALIRYRSDGRRDITVSVEPLVLRFSIGAADIVVTDSEGKVKVDTRKERLEETQRFMDLAGKLRKNDAVAQGILHSFDASVRDRDNELVRLYDIRDAFVRRFGSEDKTKATLHISNRDWSRLGFLANEAPLRQGRHRGKHVEGLRDATDPELAEARGIARRMIRSYLEWLDKQRG